jgi:hypothetical protein
VKLRLPRNSILKEPRFWNLQATYWPLVVAASMMIALVGGKFADSASPLMVVYRLVTALVLTTLTAIILQRLETLRLATPIFMFWAGLLILTNCSLVTLMGHRVYALISPQLPTREIIFATFLLRLTTYSGWTFFFLKLLADLHREKLDRKNRQAELSLLRAQVHPHFLFNSLNTIVAEAGDPERVKQITTHLSEYLRFSLKQASAGDFPAQALGEELKALDDYLQIHHIRFEEKLVSSIDAGEEVRSELVPQALVQPLLENAIAYGQRTSPLPLTIAITARITEGKIVILVENSGRWIGNGIEGAEGSGADNAARITTALATRTGESTGTGLRNLHRRLELIYGAKASLEIEQPPGKVRVRVTVPLSAKATPAPSQEPMLKP